jgi:hypothetical protein
VDSANGAGSAGSDWRDLTPLSIQQLIVADCQQAVTFWMEQNRPDRAAFWQQLADNAVQVMNGIAEHGNDYIPF